jgi:hypothetical protein
MVMDHSALCAPPRSLGSFQGYLSKGIFLFLSVCVSVGYRASSLRSLGHVVVTQSAVESEDAEPGFRTLSGDFEQVTRPQNKSHDVIDTDPNVSCEQYISTRHSSVRKENQLGNLENVSF